MIVGYSASSDKPTAPQPANSLEAGEFFTGRCYEIARTPMHLTDGCVAGTKVITVIPMES